MLDRIKAILSRTSAVAAAEEQEKTCDVSKHPGVCDAYTEIDSAYALWRSLSGFQQALYLIDEVEARWQRLKQQFRNSSRYDVSFYSLNWDNDMTGAVSNFAALLNATAVSSTQFMRPHASEGLKASFDAVDAARLDEDYKRRMRYDDGHLQPFYQNFVETLNTEGETVLYSAEGYQHGVATTAKY